jgi:hypothetical protein
MAHTEVFYGLYIKKPSPGGQPSIWFGRNYCCINAMTIRYVGQNMLRVEYGRKF